MNSNRLWAIAAIAAMVIIAVGGWFVGISPIVAQGAAANSQTASINQANQADEAKVAVLKKQFGHITKYQNKLDQLRLSIPEQTEASAFLSELNSLCSQDNVRLTSLTIASSTIYQAPASSSSGSSSGAATSTPAPTSSPAATSTAPTTTTASSGGQFVEIPVQMTVAGSVDNVITFMSDVQTASRLYLAAGSGVSLSQGSGYQGSMNGYLFTLQGTSDQPGQTTTQPTDTSTATPTATPTATATATATPTATPTKAPAKTNTKPTGAPTPGSTPTSGP